MSLGKRRLPTILVLLSLFCGWPASVTRSDEPDPALQIYVSANGLLNRGLYELAAAEYRKFLADHEDHENAPVARYGLGVCQFRMKQHAEAIGELAALAKRADFEFAAEAGTIIGQCQLALQRPDEAAEAFSQVVEKHPDHALADDAAAGRIEALYLVGRHAEAAERAAEFLERWNESLLRERVLFFAGAASMSVKDFAGAAVSFDALLDDFSNGPFAQQASLLLAQCQQQTQSGDAAARQYRRVIKEGNERFVPDALFGLSTILYRKGELDEAARLLDRFQEEFPKHTLAPRVRFLRGRVWFDTGDFDAAAKLFDSLDRDGAALAAEQAYWLAKCDLRRNRHAEAAQRLKGALRDHADHDLAAEMLYDRAVALLKADNPDDAIEALAEFRKRFSEHAMAVEALHLLAVTEHQQGRFDESDRHARLFLEQYPTHEYAGAVQFLAGENAFLAGRTEDAASAYETFLRSFPDHPQASKAVFRSGMASFRMENLDDAAKRLNAVADQAERDTLFRPALLALGEIHFRREQWKEAEARFEEYLDAGLEQTAADDALLKLGLVQQRAERHDAALQSYDRLLDHFEKSEHRLQATFERGQALVALGRDDDAREAFKKVLAEGPDSRFAPHALNHLGTLATRTGDYEAAAGYFGKATTVSTSEGLSADALFREAQSLMAAQRFTEAQKAFERFLQQFAGHELAGQAGAQRAIALSRQDEHESAVRAIADVEERHASSLDAPLRASIAYEKAWCLRELDRTEEAADAYRKLITQDSGGEHHIHAMLELAGLEMQARRFQEAAALLRKLVSSAGGGDAVLSPAVREQTLYRLGACAFELGQMRESADYFEEFIDAFPDSALLASASFHAGEARFQLGSFPDAVTHLTRVVDGFESDPVYPPALLRLGEAQAQLQHWAKSELAFSDFLSRFADSPQWFQARFGLGWSRENQKRYEEAIAAYRLVTERHQGPTAARAQFQIGECLFAEEQYDDAVRELLKVDILYAYPEWSAAALYEAGRAFEKLNKTAEARTQFKEVAERHKESHWAQLASQKLNELSSAGLPGR